MLGNSKFVNSFDNGSTDRIVVIKRALANDFHIVINHPNLTIPLCPLTARAKRQADEAAGDELRAQGKIQKADEMKHECGIAHALAPSETGRVSSLINRLGNTVNVGVHLGLSGYVVVNVDTPEQRDAFLAAWKNFSDEDISLPTIKTPGMKIMKDGQEKWKHKEGAHWWFRIPEGVRLPEHISTFVTSQGWSLLWGEAQAIVPPSRKPEGSYVLQNDATDLPSWLINFIIKIGETANSEVIDQVPVVGVDERSPFSIAAKQYRAKGWNPFPLFKDGDKYKPFRKGHTGRTGKNLTDEEIERWATSAYDLSLALRMNKGLIGIDVDGYDKKHGAEALFNIEYHHGKLPPTYRNTARLDDAVSGHRFYRVPEDAILVDRIGTKNIEILQYHHRYANAWPTINLKTGQPYRWYNPEGELMPEGFVPSIENIPPLSEAWIKYLTKPEKKEIEKRLAPEEMTDDMVVDGCTLADQTVYKLLHAPEGTRNNQLNTTSFLLGRLVSADVLTMEEAEIMVTQACEQNGLMNGSSSEVQATFNSGMNAGINNPWTPEFEFIDPEPVMTEDLEEEKLLEITNVVRKHKNPRLLNIVDSYLDIVSTCKKLGFTKGETVTILFEWAKILPYNINADQISLEMSKIWDLATGPRMVARDARRIIRKSKFLWHGRVPLGGLTFLAGEGEAGKTTLVAWIVAAVTTGTLPGSLQGTPRNVLYVRPEGSWSEVQIQFEIAEANLDRIKEIIMENPNGMDKPPTLPDDIPGFQEMCEQYDPALIIFDPLPARMNEKLSSAADADVRRALEPLTYLAQERELAVIGIHHFNKNEDADARNRMMGSNAFVNLSRSTLFVVYSAETNQRFVGIMKSNVINKNSVDTLEFKIVEEEFEAETDNGVETVKGTKIEIVGTDSRNIENIMYQIQARSKSMRSRDRSEPNQPVEA